MAANRSQRLLDAIEESAGLEWYRFLDEPVPVVVWRLSQDSPELEQRFRETVASYRGSIEWLLTAHSRKGGGHNWALRPAELDEYQAAENLPTDSAAVAALAGGRPEWCSTAVADFQRLVDVLVGVMTA